MPESHSPVWLKLLCTYIGTLIVLWALQHFTGDLLQISNGVLGLGVITLLLTVLNIIVRPILHIITLPLSLFTSVIAAIIVNGVIFELVQFIARQFLPTVAMVSLQAGIMNWLLVVLVLGVSNWAFKESF
jgi:putative membrane protein